MATGLEKVSFYSNLKERQCQEYSNYHTTALISHTSKAMFKILQAKLYQYTIHKIPTVQAGFRKGRGTRDQIANICWITDCVDHNTLWKILQEMGIPDHLICLLRNLYAGQEATELDMEQQTGSKSGKEYVKAVYCHPAYLTSMQSTS